MNLLKIFEFKGIWQSGKKMAAPIGHFRRFMNSYKNSSGSIVPFGRGAAASNVPAGTFVGDVFKDSVFSAVFKGGIFQLVRSDLSDAKAACSYFVPGQTETGIAQVFNLADKYLNMNESLVTYRPASNLSSAVIRGKLFICEYVSIYDFIPNPPPLGTSPYKQYGLLKFDGYQVSRAGLPTPFHHTIPNAAGNCRLRIVYMSVGLDGEVVFSNYLEYKTTAGSISNFYTSGYDGGSLKHADSVELAGNIFPTYREKNDSLYDFQERGVFGDIPNYYNRKFANINGVGSYTAGVGFTFPVNADSQGLEAGDWLMSLMTSTVVGQIYDAFYCKVVTVGANTTFDRVIKAYNGITQNWEDIDLDYGQPKGFASMATFLAALQANYGLSNIHVITSASLDAGGTLPYNICSILPIYWDAISTKTINTAPTTFSRPLMGTIVGAMADWYDHTQVKVTFPPVKGITSYTDLLVGFDDNAIYFTDSSLGGSTEMASGVSNLVPYGEEYGKIVAVCGSEEFLFISRERKNYVLRGELTTGGSSIVECDQPVSGAASQRACINAFGNKIMFMSKSGIYEVDASGRIVDISLAIKDLFLGKSEDNNLFDPSYMKTPNQCREDLYDNGFIKMALDEVRGLVIILTGKFTEYTADLAQSNMLVYDTKDGSWYEWEGKGATTVESLDGTTYIFGNSRWVEDGVLADDQLIAFSYIHLGEPSLEKQTNQVKIYGKFPSGDGAYIGQQNGWKKIEATVTNSDFNTYVSYLPNSNYPYYHKQRLDASKAQATSIIIHDTNLGGFEIEGIEVEISGIQEGVKK